MNNEIAIFITVLLAFLVGYFWGSLIWSTIIGKFYYNIDPRDFGSGSAGSTNTGRFLPKKVKILVFILDALKGIIPVLLIYLFQKTVLGTYLIQTDKFNSFLLAYLAGFFAILGHVSPVFFKFKGGKGIATFFGLVCMISILVAIVGFALWYILLKITKTVSFASIVSSLLTMVFIFIPGLNYFYLLDSEFSSIWSYLSTDIYITVYIFMLLLLVNIVVIYSHRNNIRKLNEKKEYSYQEIFI